MPFRSRLLVLSLLSLSSVGAFVACSSSSSGPVTPPHDSGTMTTTHDSGGSSDAGAGGFNDAAFAACTSSATAICGLQTRCNPAAQTTDYGDGGVCMTRQFLSCKDGFSVPSTGVSAAHTAGCAMAEIAESCADSLNLDPPAACNQVTGPGAMGSACSHSAQCSSGYCAIQPQNVCGTCASPPVAGDSCLALSTCGQTLACYKNSCVAFTTTSGGACSATQPCGASLNCVGASDAGSGVCQTAGATVGAACDPTQQASAGCDSQLGLYCVGKSSLPTFQTCQAVVSTGSGSACGRVDGVETICSDGTCVKGNGDDAGSTCVGRAGDNAACNTVLGPDCLLPARCSGAALDGGASGTCTLPDPSSCP